MDNLQTTVLDANNRRPQIHRKIKDNECVNLMPNLEKVYRFCIEGKTEKAAKVISEITGLLLAAEIDLGSEFLDELRIQKTMPRLLSQIRQELKKNIPSNDHSAGSTHEILGPSQSDTVS